jgi:hypothetical protein
MTTPAQRTPTRQTTTGCRVEQARYHIPAGTRVLYAQRIDGWVALVDAPLDHDDRVLLIERHIESLAELEGIVNAYVEHSTQAGMPGLLASRRLLNELADELEPDAA